MICDQKVLFTPINTNVIKVKTRLTLGDDYIDVPSGTIDILTEGTHKKVIWDGRTIESVRLILAKMEELS